MGGATRPKCEHGTPGSGPQFGHGTRLLEACASASCSRPGRAGMAPRRPWNIVTVAGFVAASLVIGRSRYFGGKIARIAALAFGHKLAAVSYNIGTYNKCAHIIRNEKVDQLLHRQKCRNIFFLAAWVETGVPLFRSYRKSAILLVFARSFSTQEEFDPL